MKTRLAVAAVSLLLATASCTSGDAGAEPLRIVLVTIDTARADRFGCYGSDKGLTPNIDGLAEDGVVFEHAVSAVPTTLPSHATMFTGLYPQDHGVRYNVMFRLGDEAYTLAEALQQAGYRTAAFPASAVLSRSFGLDQGFDTYVEPPQPTREDPMSRINAAEVVDLALEWLSGNADRKSFLWLHFYDPHAPYSPPFPYSAQYRERPYDGEIAYTDEQIGRMLAQLQSGPEWDRTVVLVTSDHGEGLFDHREAYHAYLVYETTQHVPLVIRAPRVRAGRVAEPVSLADVMPTLLDLAGVEPPGALRGVSLKPALEGREPEPRGVYFETLAGALNCGWAELSGVRYGSWKLIDSQEPQLFDLEADPGEHKNLAALETDRLDELRQALATVSPPLEGETVAEPAQEVVLDAATEAMLISLGYTGGGGGGSATDAPNPATLIELTAEMNSAQEAVSRRDWARVEADCKYMLDRDPSHKWALKTIVVALLNQERPVEAEPHAAQMLSRYPDSEHGYMMMARCRNARGDLEGAHGYLTRGLARLPDSEALTYLALTAAFEMSDDAVCTEDLPSARKKNPNSSRLAVLQARCEARDGNTGPSVDTLREAIDLGFRNLELLSRAPEFAEVVEHPGFPELERRVERLHPAEKDGNGR